MHCSLQEKGGEVMGYKAGNTALSGYTHFPYKTWPTQVSIDKPSKEHPNKFPNQNFKQIDFEFWSNLQTENSILYR